MIQLPYYIIRFFCIWGILFCLSNNTYAVVRVVYTYPLNNSTNVSPETSIGIRYSDMLSSLSINAGMFSVTGSFSGIHTGSVKLALDKVTVIFKPDIPFAPGEEVHVSVGSFQCMSEGNTLSYEQSFQIGNLQRSQLAPASSKNSDESSLSMVRTDTIFNDFPNIRITTNNELASGGNLYIANLNFAGNDSGAYLILLDNLGNILFRRGLPYGFAQDFKPQPNGMYTYFDANPLHFKFYGLDSNFNLVDSFSAANGYTDDSHELIFLPGGGYALLAENNETIDMSMIVQGGYNKTIVEEGILQEFDAEKNLIFEWRTRDHFALTDPTNTNFDLTLIDFTHCNAIVNDGDTAFLLSSRNFDEVTKINRKDGSIIWRWGGKNNEFTFVNDTLTFSRQHGVRKLPNGNITMYDNGTFHHFLIPYSRAVEYRLDERAKTATKVWEYRHTPDVFGMDMGYVQQLSDSNRLICWGACDSVSVTEITPGGETAFELKFDPGIYTYRAFKYTDVEVRAMRTKAGVVPHRSSGFSLSQNYPNPFSSSAVITFQTSEYTPIELVVYDALGREIRMLFHGSVEAGSYSSTFDSSNLPNGVYFYRLSAPSGSITKTMTILR